MVWNAQEEKKVIVKVRGNKYEVSEGEAFKEKIITLATQAGLSSFTVFVDGNEIDPDDAPATFEGIDEVSIEPYNKAGVR